MAKKIRRHWPQTPENIRDYEEMRESFESLPRGKGQALINEWLTEHGFKPISKGQWKWITVGYTRNEIVYDAINKVAAEQKLVRRLKRQLKSSDLEKLDLSKVAA